MAISNKQQKSSPSSMDVADQFSMRPVLTPAMPSQRENIHHAMRMLAAIAVRMDKAANPLPPRDLTLSPTEAMNVAPSIMEGSN